MKIRERILERDPVCVICLAKGIVTETKIVDHVLSLAEGGTDDDDNLQGLCKPCSDQKTEEESARAQGRKPGAVTKAKGVGLDGWPTSPGHHWNQ